MWSAAADGNRRRPRLSSPWSAPSCMSQGFGQADGQACRYCLMIAHAKQRSKSASMEISSWGSLLMPTCSCTLSQGVEAGFGGRLSPNKRRDSGSERKHSSATCHAWSSAEPNAKTQVTMRCCWCCFLWCCFLSSANTAICLAVSTRIAKSHGIGRGGTAFWVTRSPSKSIISSETTNRGES